MAKEKYCKVCGKKDKLRNMMCRKHSHEVELFGFTVTDSQDIEPNSIVLHKDCAELSIYDVETEYLKATVKIDIDDIDTVSSYTWNKGVETILSKDINGNTIMLKQVIADDFESNIKHINNDYLDCRKSNLQLVKKQKKKKRSMIVSKKNKNKVIVEFVGKSKEQVTGSAILVSVPLKNGEYKKVLVEFGASQTNRDLYTEYLMNKEIVDSVPCDDIDYTFILHTHQDHVGNAPALIPNGFKGKVITTKENTELLQPMLLDAAYIHNKNVKAMNSKKHSLEPLYTESDVYLLMNRIEKYTTHEIHKLTDEISFKFANAAHILGSCQLVLYVKTPTGQIKSIHVTSDLGSDYNRQRFIPEKDIVTSSSVSIFEATYNDLNRGFSSKKEVVKERRQFKAFIKNELENKRSILIGAFAQSRQQNLLEFLYSSFKYDKTFNYPIYVDGVLGHSINNVYLSILKDEDKEYWREVMSWKNIHYITSYENSQSVALNKDETKIVISSGGMFSSGRILNHLKTMIEDKRNTIVICGYQAEGCIGHELQRKEAKTVKIEGIEYNKRAKIHQLSTWSSHIMANENINYMSQIKTPLLLIHHSDKGKCEFRDIVETKLREKNNTAKVVSVTEENNIFYI